jgi:uncharacterized protein YggL (DUF469 family)
MLKTKPKFSRNRSRRLRKKLCVDEFQIRGFHFCFIANNKNDEAIMNAVCEWIESNKMLVACSTYHGKCEGYVAQEVGMGISSENTVFHKWCESSGFLEIEVSDLSDANYLS